MCTKRGQVAQLVEQRTENPRAEGSSPPLTTMNFQSPSNGALFFVGNLAGREPCEGNRRKAKAPSGTFAGFVLQPVVARNGAFSWFSRPLA